MESTPKDIAGRSDQVHRHQPPCEPLYGNGLLERYAEKAGDDGVDGNGSGDIAVLGANELGSDQPCSLRRTPTMHRRFSVTMRHEPMLAVCVWKPTAESEICVVSGTLRPEPGKAPKKKAGLFRPGLLPFKTPVSGIDNAQRCFKKAT